MEKKARIPKKVNKPIQMVKVSFVVKGTKEENYKTKRGRIKQRIVDYDRKWIENLPITFNGDDIIEKVHVVYPELSIKSITNVEILMRYEID